MIIDVFSKFGWAVPIKSKTGAEIKNALETIFSHGKTPKNQGTEFYNKDVKSLFGKYKITLYSTANVEICSVIERWNRTIKTQLWKYFTANSTHEYIDVLQPLIDRYNNTKNRATRYIPTDARKPSNYQHVFKLIL